jgi:orotidine-5'-phosphate decarboxylase
MRRYKLIFAGENTCVVTTDSLTCALVKSKLIVALDVDSFDQAATLVRDLAGVVDIFKVGSQLFTRVGPRIVEFINAAGKQVFLDLKFHDIPNTVAKAVESAAALKVFMLTVHVSGGPEMLKAAAGIPVRPVLLGVTVLTSVAGNVSPDVLRYAQLARECGLDGVIASPHEVKMLREVLGGEYLIVTPGIRPSWAMAGDQKRVMTPAEAVAAGASYIVVGRPIVDAARPSEAALRIISEMALANR